MGTGEPIEAPAPLPPDEVEAAVADGLLIARFSAVLALKNRLIVSALRDDLPFAQDTASAAFAEVSEELAEEHERNAAHASELMAQVESDAGVARHEHDYKSRDVELLAARRTVYRAVARQLLEDARNPDTVSAVVEDARSRAWDEIAREIASRLDQVRAIDRVVVDDAYRRDRDERMRRLREFDLWQLADSRR
jgi:hypothetical protein